MIICKYCGFEVYMRQRYKGLKYYDEPYFCLNCEGYLNYNEVTYKK